MSTQTLTELPIIQRTGMDFESVVDEIQNIIADNPNWRSNWNEFRDSEAGAMLIELFAWITDNFTTRQDLLFNEMFIGTAQDDRDKVRHLKQIGYVPKMPHSAKVPIKITFGKKTETDNKEDKIVITKRNGNESLILRPSTIANFTSSDINGVSGEEIYWEIIKMRNGKPEYLEEVSLNPGKIEYEQDSEENDLYAFQGKTKCEEFKVSTKDGSFFTLKEKNIASDSIQVYIQDTYDKLLQVKSFISSEALDENNPIPYVVELNEDRTYNIRFANKNIAKDSRLIKAGKTIFVFYRTCDGEVGNVKPGIISASLNCTTKNGKSMICQVTNDFPAVGGSNIEKLTDAVMNGPLSLTTMDRAVTPDDYNIILRNNTNIYKAKTYTSSNQPEGFKDYYGRFINPQESFTFLMTNKNHKGVPTERYNDFPWLTTIKEPRINEKYIFDKGKFNDRTNIKGKSYNLKVTEGSDMFFNNATIIDVGETFNSGLYIQGKANTQLKLKLNNEITKELFLNEVPFGIFSQDDVASYIDANKNSKIIFNDNAKFITKDVIDLNTPVDIKNSNLLSFEMDNGALSTELIDLADNSDIDTLSHYYLKWDNENPTKAPSTISADSKEMADYRDGIVQIINKSINNAVRLAKNFNRNAGSSKQPLGLKVDLEDNILIDDKYFSLKFYTKNENIVDERIYVFPKPEETFIKIENLKEHLNECFADPVTKKVQLYNKEKKIVPASESDRLFLNKYSVDIFRFNREFNGNEDSILVVNSVGDAKAYSYDLYIYSNEQETLSDFEYDFGGAHYIVNNAINIEDPTTYVRMKINNILTDVKGLFQIISKNNDGPVNRVFGNIPNVYPKCSYENRARIIGDDNNKRFEIISPLKGPISSFYFKSTSRSSNDFSKNILKVPFDKDGTESYKVFGQKKAYMLLSDPLIVQNIFDGAYINNTSLDIKAGNIIFENSCIFNSYDFSNVYASYKLNSLDEIELGSSYDNFYFTGDELKDDKLKSKVKGLLGQKVIPTKINNKLVYVIDKDKSNYNVKLTKEAQDTNSLFAIEDDLGAICKSYVEIKTNKINLNNKSELINYKLHLKVDNKKELGLTLNSLNEVNDASDFIKKVKDASIKAVTENVEGSTFIRDNFNSIFKLYYRNDEIIVINSVSKYDGSITFYNSKDEANDLDYLENDKKFYKWLLGTNKTNPDFYNLHNYISQEKNIIPTENEGEYFYCPDPDNPLEFKFRKIVNNESRGADYTLITRQDINTNTCTFFLKKEKDGRFPDNYFYVHFINDKSYDFNDKGLLNETDESIFQKYMSKSKISGTDITFLQPYFKTYDIEATVSYNSDFTSAAEIKSKIEDAIDDLCGLENAKIGGKITKSEVNYIIRSCEGVMDLVVDYLGYNALDKVNNIDMDIIESPFYSINCIHETTEEGRGLKLKLKSI